METLQIRTQSRDEMVDITAGLHGVISENGWLDGALVIFCPHTTGAITINEGSDPDVVRDIIGNMRKLIPQRGDYLHAEGNSDSHIKSSLFGCDQLVIVEGGNIKLGTWQKIYFCEFDGPRVRSVYLQWLGA